VHVRSLEQGSVCCAYIAQLGAGQAELGSCTRRQKNCNTAALHPVAFQTCSLHRQLLLGCSHLNPRPQQRPSVEPLP